MSSEKRIAIVGMACLFPGAPDLASFWQNIVGGVDAIRDVGDGEWDADQYYDRDAKAFGKTYCKRGGFITEFAHFDPLKAGVMPSTVAGSDPDQFLALKVAQEALADAGYKSSPLSPGGTQGVKPQSKDQQSAALKPLNGDRAEVILGRIGAPGAGAMNLIQQSKTMHEIVELLATVLPEGNEETIKNVAAQLQERLQPCTSDNIPGVMPNILAGRIAAKLGFRGRNLLVDAACASSMVAVETAVDDLLSGRCDFALAGGLHVNSSVTMFNLFAGLGALSRTETIRPFDEDADGTLLGEGLGMICLKRLDDALRDGDRIYSTICAVASSSDGYGGSVLAPSAEGEALAMTKAYEMAGVSPSTIELLEAHGTATPAGDVVEMEAVAKVFGANTTDKQWCAVGSVKSMIGHCQSASAIAGIIKAALALHHKVLPPTLNVSKPNSKIHWDEHPCYVNTVSRPWIKAQDANHPRRAAVSAFGFGGINSHTILEEHNVAVEADQLYRDWDSELLTFAAATPEALQKDVAATIAMLEARPNVALKDLAYTLNCARKVGDHRLAVVASSTEELLKKLRSQRGEGVYAVGPEDRVEGKLAFLYPGLGSAYTNMLGDLCIHFPEVRKVFEIVDTVASAAGATVRPSDLIFPRSPAQASDNNALVTADFAVVAVLLAEYAIHELLRHFEINPDALMGCSTGEFAAITNGGAVEVLSAAETFYRLSTEVGRKLPAEQSADLRSLRVLSSQAIVVPMFGDREIYLTADLGDDHIIVTGGKTDIDHLTEKLRAKRIAFQVLPTAIPYHTPLAGRMVDTDSAAVKAIEVKELALPIWSCATASLFKNEVPAIRASFTELFAKPISLRETIRAMYADGVRKFVEIGPNGVLTLLVSGILSGKPHVAVASNLAARTGLTQLHHLLGTLFAQGVAIKFDYLYERRAPRKLDVSELTPSPVKSNVLPLAHVALQVDRSSLPPLLADDGFVETKSAGGESEDAVMQAFLQTNTEFFSQLNALHQDVMSAYLAVQPEVTVDRVTLIDEYELGGFDYEELAPDSINAEGTSGNAHELPLLGGAQISADLDSTVISLQVDLGSHLYLLDHAIGGMVSTNPAIRVHLMPLMVALEMMAEAALVHVGSGVVIRLESVKAFRRIFVDASGLRIDLVVRDFNGAAHVELYQDNDEQPSMVADVVFAAAYEQAPAAKLNVSGSAPTKLTSAHLLYNEDAMFHGPRMQSVWALECVGNKSIAGKAAARNAFDWVPGTQRPHFLLDPLLLDNASQFVLFYLYEKNLPAIALLPFYIEKINIYGDCVTLQDTGAAATTAKFNSEDFAELYGATKNAPESEDDFADLYSLSAEPKASAHLGNVSVSAVLPTLSDRATEANVEILDSSGSLFCSIHNINSRRVAVDATWRKFILDPLSNYLTQFDTVSGGIIASVEQQNFPTDDVILDWCADYLLTRSERAAWQSNSKTDRRRADWLLGRVAAKDAVRKLVLEKFGVKLGPHDVEITSDESRVPFVKVSHSALPQFAVSISHSNGAAVAFASLETAGSPGVDLEEVTVHDQDFEKMFLSADEREYLNSCKGDQRALESTRLWAAKEAVFKAFHGKVEMPQIKAKSIAMNSIDITMSTPHGDVTVPVKLRGDRVIAWTQPSLPAFSLS